MNIEKTIPLKDIDDGEEFWCGTKLRKRNIGRNVSKELDFYDYILAFADWDSENMMLVNITENNIKAGYVYGGTLPIDKSSGKFVVTKSAFKHALGDDLTDWYLLVVR